MKRLIPTGAATALATVLALSTAALLAGCATPQTDTQAAQSPQKNTAALAGVTTLQESEKLAHYRLPNGLELIVKPDRRAPTAIHMLWVRAGSIDEDDGTSGIAHMLEHMMFKGSAQLAPGEFSRRVSELGGQDNAFTSLDYTAYYQQVPASALETVMAMEAERFMHNQWPDEEFVREVEVVKEERRARTDDQPRARLYEQLMASAYTASPERRPIIGWMNDIAQYTPDDARQFYRRWYRPGNAAVVVVGQVEPREVLQLVQRHYGSAEDAALPPRKITAEPAQHGPRRIALHAPAKQPMLIMAFKVPPLKNLLQPQDSDREALALMVLAGVLSGYDGARLEKALVRGPQRVADAAAASAQLHGRSGNGLFLLNAIPAEGTSTAALEQALRRSIADVAERGVGQEELARVITQWTATTIYAQDSMFAQAMDLGTDWIEGWPLDATERTLALLREVTPEQVQAAARRHFGDQALTVAELVAEKGQKPQAQKPQTAGQASRH